MVGVFWAMSAVVCCARCMWRRLGVGCSGLLFSVPPASRPLGLPAPPLPHTPHLQHPTSRPCRRHCHRRHKLPRVSGQGAGAPRPL